MIYTRFLYLISLSFVFITSKTYVEGEEPNLITDVNRNSIISNLSSKEEKSKNKKEDDTKPVTKSKSTSDKKVDDSKPVTETKKEKSDTKIELAEKKSEEDKPSINNSKTLPNDNAKKEDKSSKSGDKSSDTKSGDKTKAPAGSDGKGTEKENNKKSNLFDSDTYNSSIEEPLKISRLIGTENPSTQNQKSELTDNLFEFVSKLDSTDEKTKNTNILSNLASPIFGNLNEGSHHGSSKDKTSLG